MRKKKYNQDGIRLTDCCGAYSTYHMDFDGHDYLCCKACYREVSHGEGDGTERQEEGDET